MIDNATIYEYDLGSPINMYAAPPPIPDAHGVKWGLFDIDGWSDGLDVRQAVFPVPFVDGALYDHFSYQPRLIDLHGGFVAPSRAVANSASRRLMGAVEVRRPDYNDAALRSLLVDEIVTLGETYQLFVNFRRAGAPTLKWSQYGRACEFSIPLICPDGRKLSRTQYHVSQVDATVIALSILSGGDTPTWADNMLLTGPITNPVITHVQSGMAFKFNGALGSGQSVGMNFHPFVHSVGGTLNRSNVDPSSRWFPILPGVNTYNLTGTGPDGNTKLEVYWQDAYQ